VDNFYGIDLLSDFYLHSIAQRGKRGICGDAGTRNFGVPVATRTPILVLIEYQLVRGRNVDRWIIIHWFELSTLVLLGLNLWFVVSVLNVLRATNHWLTFLSRVQWDQAHGADSPP